MSQTTRGLILLSLVAAFARPSAAGDWSIGLEGGYADLTSASKSAQAVFDGSSGGVTFGGTVRVTFARDAFFAGVGGRYFSKEGERAFVASPTSDAFGLGHPLKVRMIPAFAQGGWRITPDSSFVPYVGIGVGILSYHEESTVGGLAEEPFDRTKPAGQVLGGVEYGRGAVRFGVEVAYSFAPKTLGLGGVSEVYGEDDPGGFSAVGRIIFVP